MPRPTKEFLDYFPIYCRGDERTDVLKAKKGMTGFGIYISLLIKLYGEKGYYLNWNDNICCIFASNVGVSEEEVYETVNLLINVGLFNKDIYERYSILTSKEIQENYLFAITKRKNKDLDKRFDLVSAEETGVYGEETRVYGEETPVSVTESTQRKEKEIKENKSIENESRGGVSPSVKTKDHTPAPAKRGRMNNVILTDTEYQQLKASYPDIDSTIERMSSYMASTGKSYHSHYATLIRWAEEDTARGSIAPTYRGYAPQTHTNTKAASRESEGGFGESYDFDEFFTAAVRRGQNLYPISPENGQNEGVPNGTLH